MESSQSDKLGRILAALLWYGTWAASALIAIGMGLKGIQPLPASTVGDAIGHASIKTGVALLIGLPAARVLVLFAVFLHRRDPVYAIISACVLAILGAGLLVGIYT